MNLRQLASKLVTARGATSQADLAVATGETAKRINEYETAQYLGAKKHPDLSTLKRMARKLGKDLNCRDFIG